MMDSREQVAKEFAGQVFERLFVQPRGWDEHQASAHIEAAVEAVRPMLPRDRVGALDLCKRAGQRLKAEGRTNAWPTVREVCEAIREERKVGASDGGTDWPHRNSEAVIEITARYVHKHRHWPVWLSHPGEVARELLNRGLANESDLADAGYGPAVDRRVAADRARVEAVQGAVAARFPSSRDGAA